MEELVAIVDQVPDRLESPPVDPVVENVPDKEGTGPPYVMLAAFAVAVTARGLIVRAVEFPDAWVMLKSPATAPLL